MSGLWRDRILNVRINKAISATQFAVEHPHRGQMNGLAVALVDQKCPYKAQQGSASYKDQMDDHMVNRASSLALTSEDYKTQLAATSLRP